MGVFEAFFIAGVVTTVLVAAAMSFENMYEKVQRSLKLLEEEREERKSIEQALLDIMDEDGEIRGRLAIPSKTGTIKDNEIEAIVHKNEETTLALLNDVEKLKDDIASLKQQKLNVIRTAPTISTINRTPCGELCRYAFWPKHGKGFRCRANEGNPTFSSRKLFLDDEGQCAIFSPSNEVFRPRKIDKHV